MKNTVAEFNRDKFDSEEDFEALLDLFYQDRNQMELENSLCTIAEDNLRQAVQSFFFYKEAGQSSSNFTDSLADLLSAQIELQKYGYHPDVIKARSHFEHFGIYANVVKEDGPYQFVELKSFDNSKTLVVLENGYFREFAAADNFDEALAA